MSTQIDSLSIKIEASSKDASAAIDQLAKALQQLGNTSALSQLEKTLRKISNAATAGMKNVPAHFNRISKAANSASKSTNNFASSIMRLAGTAVGIHTLAKGLNAAWQAASEWDGISARFGESFGEQADEVYAHVQKLSDAMHVNDQAFMQYAGNFATLAKGFGVTGKNVAAMSTGLTELAYDIYAKSNDFYKFEEAMDAVRSAVVGEVEPIRKAGISITEAMLKETAAANGITQSVESMTEAQKAQLRYKAMIDQAYASGTVGTFASEINTAEGMVRALSQQLQGLTQALGGLFIPILSAVIPYIQAFVSLLTSAINAIAMFFGFSIKAPSWSSGVGSATDSVGDLDDALTSAGGSAKKLKGLLAGFDELNIIQSKNSGGGGGGAAGGGGDLGLELESLWTDEMVNSVITKTKAIADGIIKFLQPLKDAILAIDFAPIAESLSRLGESVGKLVSTAGLSAYWFLHQVLVPIAGTVIEGALPSFFDMLATAVDWATQKIMDFHTWMVLNKEEMLSLPDKISELLKPFKDAVANTDFTALIDSISLLGEKLWGLVSTVGEGAYWFLTEVLVPLAGIYIEERLPAFFNTLSDAVSWATEKFSALWDWMKANKDLVIEITDKVIIFIAVFSLMKTVSNIVKTLSNVVGGLGTKFGRVAAGITLILDGVPKLISAFKDIFDGGGMASESVSALSVGLLEVGAGLSILTGNWLPLIIAGIGAGLIWIADNLDGIKAAATGNKEAFNEWLSDKDLLKQYYLWLDQSIITPVDNFLRGIAEWMATFRGWINQKDTKVIEVSYSNKTPSGYSYTSTYQMPVSVGGGKNQYNMKDFTEYASGGFPTEGQLFIAREAGAELVGSMNGRTAVANNDQIVEGIASGVANGQAEQNALLRQQNNILMQLLNKNFTATVAPSPALGRVNAQSAALYSKMTGV